MPPFTQQQLLRKRANGETVLADAPETPQTHVLSILIENHAGALNRVVNLFSARNLNLDSVSVGPTDDETVSRLTVVTTGTRRQVRVMRHGPFLRVVILHVGEGRAVVRNDAHVDARRAELLFHQPRLGAALAPPARDVGLGQPALEHRQVGGGDGAERVVRHRRSWPLPPCRAGRQPLRSRRR